MARPVHLAALAAAGLLAACEPAHLTALPPARGASAESVAPVAVHAPDPQMVDYFRRVEATLRSRGLLRTDGGTADAPFSTRDVVDIFMKVAFYSEYAERGGRLVASQTPGKLLRWETPVRMGVVVGDGVPVAQADRDRAAIVDVAARIGRVTRHPVSVVDGTGNFTVLILTEGERRRAGTQISGYLPDLTPATLSAIVDMPPSVYCLVVARDGSGGSAYSRAVAVIRAEHPDLLRLSCIHEELAQGMGLANDTPRARPSVFNDDEEFALLTPLDDILLRILYDRRLRPGMTEAEARSIVETIAAEITGGAS